MVVSSCRSHAVSECRSGLKHQGIVSGNHRSQSAAHDQHTALSIMCAWYKTAFQSDISYNKTVKTAASYFTSLSTTHCSFLHLFGFYKAKQPVQQLPNQRLGAHILVSITTRPKRNSGANFCQNLSSYCKIVFSFNGALPPNTTPGLCLWTSWRHSPQTPNIVQLTLPRSL